jgi:hypothetical protein
MNTNRTQTSYVHQAQQLLACLALQQNKQKQNKASRSSSCSKAYFSYVLIAIHDESRAAPH